MTEKTVRKKTQQRKKTLTPEIPLTEKDLKIFFQLSSEIFGVIGSDGKFQKVNHVWQKVLGWKPEELRARSWLSLVHPKDAAAAFSFLQRSNLTGCQFENRYSHKQGLYLWVSWKVIRGENGLIYVAGTDITASKRLNRQLSKQEEYLGRFFSTAPLGLAIFDKYQRFLHVNQTLAEIHGLAPSQHFGKTYSQILPHLAPALESFLQRFIENPQRLNSEFSITFDEEIAKKRKWQISLFPLLNSTEEFVSVGALVVEITHSQKEELLLHPLSHISEVVFLTTDSGQITYVSPNIYPIFLCSVAEAYELGDIEKLFGKNLFDTQTLNSTGEIRNIYREIRDKNGLRRLLLVSVKRVDLPSGTLLYTCRDISDLISEEGKAELFLIKDIKPKHKLSQNCLFTPDNLHNIFQELPIAMAIFSLDYRFVKVNTKLCQMLGYRESQLRDHNPIEITHPEDIETELALYHRAFKAALPSYTLEKRYLKKNGEILWVIFRGYIIREQQGKPLYLLAILEDITQQKAVQAQRCPINKEINHPVGESTQ